MSFTSWARSDQLTYSGSFEKDHDLKEAWRAGRRPEAVEMSLVYETASTSMSSASGQ